ncbi:hypothetical protein EJ08DRAFT_644541 [Tothia fuscella]|uniref:Rrn9 domain-containing protein n=1 Tax=Tothia fuscella TaxID=1048955 RepID=A0A9P4U5D7_9PEZI|nr:hypothetical protein EJ08DRAFT_644541 [Tothia fuscella]
MSLFGGDTNSQTAPSFETDSNNSSSPSLHNGENDGAAQRKQHIEPSRNSSLRPGLGNDGPSESSSDEREGQAPLSHTEIEQRRRWQADELRLATSVEAQKAGDINENLHQVTKERRTHQLHSVKGGVKPWHSRQRWAANNDTDTALPTSEWTGWPLDSHEVPRPEEWFDNPRFGSKSYRPNKRRKLAKPSAEVEDILSDIALSKYRKRWAQQTTAWEAETSTASISNSQDEHSDRRFSQSEPATRLGPTEPDSRSSRPIWVNHRGRPVPNPNNILRKPVFSTDDQRSRRLVQPRIRRIMSGLDDLLTGLYHSRNNHDKASTYASLIKSADQDEAPKHVIQSKSDSTHGVVPPYIKARGREQAKSAGPVSGRDRGSESPPGLRDWSEVLGMAALTGWNPQAVDRATKRCARLFGEGMSFLTLLEEEVETPKLEPVQYVPTLVNTPLLSKDLWTLGSLICPHEDCPRNTGGSFEGRHRLVTHIRAVHKWDPRYESMPEEMYGGVHVDGFMQPIIGRPGWRGRSKNRLEDDHDSLDT